MVYSAHVRNGAILLDHPVDLPEGAAVTVEICGPEVAAAKPNGAPTLFERLQSVVGAAQGLPEDAASQIDHYLYGHPRT
ncbi:MAG: hypothetical protein AB7U20_08860 [Planctomycetaceae bacterium]